MARHVFLREWPLAASAYQRYHVEQIWLGGLHQYGHDGFAGVFLGHEGRPGCQVEFDGAIEPIGPIVGRTSSSSVRMNIGAYRPGAVSW